MADAGFLDELKRRKVLRVAMVYAAGAFALLEFADIAAPRLGLPDTAVDAVLVAGLLGFPVALALAWLVEARLDRGGAEAPEAADGRAPWLSWPALSMALLLLGLGVLLGRLSGAADDGDARGSALPTMVVLPFDNLSGQRTADYFGRGLTEDIGATLGRYPGVRVIDPEITFPFQASATDLDALRRTFAADYAITGSVRRSQDRVRVSAQLYDLDRSTQLWAQTYDESLTAENLFDVQADIAERVVATLADPTGVLSQVGWQAARRRPTEVLAAYDCVLRGYAYVTLHTAEAHLAARNCLERAVELDPDYADAWAHLSYVYREEFQHNFNPRTAPLERAEAAAQRALALDPNNAMGHYALGSVKINRGDVEGAIAQIDRALALNPTDTNYLASMALYFAYAGRDAYALDLARRAQALNPTPPEWLYHALAVIFYARGDYERALQELSRGQLGDDSQSLLHRAVILAALGRPNDARAVYGRLLDSDPVFAADPAGEIRRYLLGDTPLARDYLRRLEALGVRLSAP